MYWSHLNLPKVFLSRKRDVAAEKADKFHHDPKNMTKKSGFNQGL